MTERLKGLQGLQCYKVGGAIRDRMLGISAAETDWLVVGANAATMQARGFRSVGKHFPVFLHPETAEEYALARKEIKHGIGHKAFDFIADETVSVADDLMRRDLTINAVAEDAEGRITDPYGGQQDLARGILRHVSAAFSEDPLRVFRTARFFARFAHLGFTIHADTLNLMRTMRGELASLSAERVWQETAKALATASPWLYFSCLHEVGALEVWMPELARLNGVPQPLRHHPEGDAFRHTLLTLEKIAESNADAPDVDMRYAMLCHDVGKGVTPAEHWPKHHNHEVLGVPETKRLNERLRAPKRAAMLAILATRWHGVLHKYSELRPATIYKVLRRTQALSHPARFAQLLAIARADSQGRHGFWRADYPADKGWMRALAVLKAVDFSDCANHKNPADAVANKAIAALSAVR